MDKEIFLSEGDIFELKNGNSVYVKNFPKAFLYNNGDFDFSLTSGTLTIGGEETGGLDTSIFGGKYVVVKTTSDGGGSSHDGGYPDGHHIYARKIINDIFNNKEIVSEFEVNFYQSGCFTCMITDIISIGKCKPTYVLNESKGDKK